MEKNLMPDEYDCYLEGLKRSGVTNMFGATRYLQYEFGLDKRDAREILSSWMRHYEEFDFDCISEDAFDYDYDIFF